MTTLQWEPTEGRFDGDKVYTSAPRRWTDIWADRFLLGRWNVPQWRRVVVTFKNGKWISVANAVVAFFILASAAGAAPTSDNPPAAQTEQIQVRKAIALANAIAAVTGLHEEIVGQGANQRSVMMPYNLSADTRWSLTDDLSALNAMIETAQKVQKQLVADAEAKAPDDAKDAAGHLKAKKDAVLDAAGKVVVDAVASPEQTALNDELQKIMDSERPVAKLFHVKRADLKLADNPIPGLTLDALKPIIDP